VGYSCTTEAHYYSLVLSLNNLIVCAIANRNRVMSFIITELRVSSCMQWILMITKVKNMVGIIMYYTISLLSVFMVSLI